MRGAFPDEATANAADLMALGQKLGYAMPDLSDERRQHVKLEDLVGAPPSDIPGGRDSTDEPPTLSTIPFRSGRPDTQSSTPQTRESSEEPAPLVRDAAGNEHYIGPSGTLAFFAQLRQLLETSQSASTAAEHMAAAKFTKDTTAHALEADPSAEKESADTPGAQSQSRPDEAQSPGSITSAIAQDFARLPTTKLEDILRQFPSDEVLELLIESYFKHVHDDFPLFHRATFEDEYEMYIVQGRQRPPGLRNREKGMSVIPDWGWIGCLHMMIVFGSISGPRIPGIDHTALRRRSVAATRSLLPQFLSKSTLSNVRVLLLLALFLHNNNERNAAWNLVGTATRISFALGLHRSDTGPSYRFLEREVRKWVFCTLFAFEQFLASSLGRPSGLHEIDVEIVPPKEGYLDSGTGADARLIAVSVKLQGILAKTRLVHLAKGSSNSTILPGQVPSVKNVLESLDAWKKEVKELNGIDLPLIKDADSLFPDPPEALDLEELRTSLSWRTPAQLRPLLILHIQFHYIGLLATRSILLRDVANSRKPNGATTVLSDNSLRCVEHACQLAFLALLLDDFGIVNGLVGLDIFYAYCAAMVLLLRLLRITSPETPSKKKSHITEEQIQASIRSLVAKLQDVMAQADKGGSFKRFTKVVESFAEAVTNPAVPTSEPHTQVLNQTFMMPQPPPMHGYQQQPMAVYELPPGAHPHAHAPPPQHHQMGVIGGYDEHAPHMQPQMMEFFPVGPTFGQQPGPAGMAPPPPQGMGAEDVPMPLYSDMEMLLGGYGVPRGSQG